MEEELIAEIRNKWKEVRAEINRKYRVFYPEKNDNEGWKLRGRMEALSWVLQKLENAKK